MNTEAILMISECLFPFLIIQNLFQDETIRVTLISLTLSGVSHENIYYDKYSTSKALIHEGFNTNSKKQSREWLHNFKYFTKRNTWVTITWLDSILSVQHFVEACYCKCEVHFTLLHKEVSYIMKRKVETPSMESIFFSFDIENRVILDIETNTERWSKQLHVSIISKGRRMSEWLTAALDLIAFRAAAAINNRENVHRHQPTDRQTMYVTLSTLSMGYCVQKAHQKRFSILSKALLDLQRSQRRRRKRRDVKLVVNLSFSSRGNFRGINLIATKNLHERMNEWNAGRLFFLRPSTWKKRKASSTLSRFFVY